MGIHPRTDDRGSSLFRRSSLIALLPAVMMIAVACQSGGSSSRQPTAASEWPQANHDFANTRAASGSTISSGNVHNLGVGWTLGVGGASTFGSLATSPIVVDGTVYLQDLKSNVYAIDLRTGRSRTCASPLGSPSTVRSDLGSPGFLTRC